MIFRSEASSERLWLYLAGNLSFRLLKKLCRAFQSFDSSHRGAETVTSLGQLHLVVARIEGIRGHCINARRHASAATKPSQQGPEGSDQRLSL